MSQTTTQPASPAERIAVMKAVAAEKKAAQEREQERTDRRNSLETLCREDLINALVALEGLPVTPNGVVVVRADQRGGSGVCVERKGWNDFDGETETEYEVILAFAVESNFEGTEAPVTHDGDVIAHDVALDLAIAAVEARFDG